MNLKAPELVRFQKSPDRKINFDGYLPERNRGRQTTRYNQTQQETRDYHYPQESETQRSRSDDHGELSSSDRVQRHVFNASSETGMDSGGSVMHDNSAQAPLAYAPKEVTPKLESPSSIWYYKLGSSAHLWQLLHPKTQRKQLHLLTLELHWAGAESENRLFVHGNETRTN